MELIVNDLAVRIPNHFSIVQSKRFIGAVVRGEIAGYVADFCRSLRDGGYALPQLPIEPLQISEDDEHVWIGLDM